MLKSFLQHATTAALAASVGILYSMHTLPTHADIQDLRFALTQTKTELTQTRTALSRYSFTLFRGTLPRDIEAIAVAEAHRQELDPALVLSVIQQESDGNPQAKSRAGAVGLMQLMPGTAKDLNVTDRFCPVQNVKGGVAYLRKLLDRYGNVTHALYAYNWGMGNVDSWLKTGFGSKGQPMPRETREYAPSVLSRIERIAI